MILTARQRVFSAASVFPGIGAVAYITPPAPAVSAGSWIEDPRGITWSAPVATTLVKRPAESRFYTMDLSQLPELAGGDTISSVKAVAASVPGAGALTVGSPSIVNSSTGVQVQVSGGTVGATYTVSFTVATAAGSTLGGVGYVNVSDQ
jgi:hypothetical protein